MQNNPENLLRDTLKTCMRAVLYALLFSFMINLLSLAMPLYMLQILDRVLATGSSETLVMLSVIVVGTFICLGFIQVARSYIFLAIGSYFDKQLSPVLLRASISAAAQREIVSASQSIRDLGVIKGFLTKQGLGAIFDLPWTPIYLIAIFFIHPYNAMIAIAGSAILLVLAVLNETVTAEPLKETNEYYIKSMVEIDSVARNADVVEAMGMKTTVVKNWEDLNRKVLSLANYASGKAIIISTASQIARLLTQVVMVGTSTYLVLNHQMSPGGIVATSILAGKVLAPFNVAISAWRNCVNARNSYGRIKYALEKMRIRQQQIDLPEPRGIIDVEKVFFQMEGMDAPILKNLNVHIDAGDSVGIIGKSSAGKTTLCKLLTGVWKASAGSVRLDSIDVFEWGRDFIKHYIGYLPQDVELLNGTIKENIARMEKDPDESKVFAAAKMAGLHEMILRLPQGYDTMVGRDGEVLSGGMRQRVGLARAFFDDPKVVILDEPNSNLDLDGDQALLSALEKAKAKGITVLIISHRPTILLNVDKIIVMHEGCITDFGESDVVLDKFAGKLK